MAEQSNEEIIEAIPSEAIAVNENLKYTIFTKKADTYHIYLQRGKRFGAKERLKLKSQRAEFVYIKQSNKKTFLADALKNIDEIDKKVKSKDALVLLYHDLLTLEIDNVFNNALNKKSIIQIHKFMIRIVDLVLSASSCVAKLISTIEDHSTKYEHSMNVMVYSLSLGKMLGLNQSQLEHLSLGALLHDIARGKKDYDDKKHPERGVKILDENGITNEITQRIVLEHHEYLDGSGFPKGLSKNEISQFSQLVTIANTFDNLCSADRENLSTFESLKQMKSKMVGKLNADALNSFILMFKRHS